MESSACLLLTAVFLWPKYSPVLTIYTNKLALLPEHGGGGTETLSLRLIWRTQTCSSCINGGWKVGLHPRCDASLFGCDDVVIIETPAQLNPSNANVFWIIWNRCTLRRKQQPKSTASQNSKKAFQPSSFPFSTLYPAAELLGSCISRIIQHHYCPFTKRLQR